MSSARKIVDLTQWSMSMLMLPSARVQRDVQDERTLNAGCRFRRRGAQWPISLEWRNATQSTSIAVFTAMARVVRSVRQENLRGARASADFLLQWGEYLASKAGSDTFCMKSCPA
jgi:hypothetical protein